MRKFSVAAMLLAFPLWAAELKLGKPVDVPVTTGIHELLAHPEDYLGKEVKIEGEITAVCQNMGCWINVKDPGSGDTLTVKVNDGEIVFPKDGAGKKVVAQGRFEKIVMSRDQYIAYLTHQAKESGTDVDTSGISGGRTVYRIKGSGAEIR